MFLRLLLYVFTLYECGQVVAVSALNQIRRDPQAVNFFVSSMFPASAPTWNLQGAVGATLGDAHGLGNL
jgi:hypothetical protein